MKISRRQLLLSGTAVAAVAIIGTAVVAPVMRGAEALIAEIVRYHLPFKQIDQRELTVFAETFEREDNVTDKTKLKLLTLASPLIFSPGLRKSLPQKVLVALDNYERRVLTQFLLSTDFFEHEDPYVPELTYYGFYDQGQACGYPLVES